MEARKSSAIQGNSIVRTFWHIFDCGGSVRENTGELILAKPYHSIVVQSRS